MVCLRWTRLADIPITPEIGAVVHDGRVVGPVIEPGSTVTCLVAFDLSGHRLWRSACSTDYVVAETNVVDSDVLLVASMRDRFALLDWSTGRFTRLIADVSRGDRPRVIRTTPALEVLTSPSARCGSVWSVD